MKIRTFLFTIVLLTCFLAFLPSTVSANTPTTSDPERAGFQPSDNPRGKYQQWENYVPACPACGELADQYNETMRKLTAFRIKLQKLRVDYEELKEETREYHDRARMQERADEKEARKAAKEGRPVQPQGMEGLDHLALGLGLSTQELFEALENEILKLSRQIDALASAARALRIELEACERQKCNAQQEGRSRTSTGSLSVTPLPFDWKGPYAEVCLKCARLAERLNALPGLARVQQALLEEARARKALAEYNMRELQAGTVFDEKRMQSQFKGYESEMREAEQDISRAEGNLNAIRRNFEETLALYNGCIKTCRPQEGRRDTRVAACPSPRAETPIRVGTASEVGALGKTKSELKSKALGMAMGGGGGFGFGGGKAGGMESMVPGPMSGGGKGDKPKTEKDPVKAKVEATAPGGSKLALGAIARNGSLLVSTAIKDSPGKGTFQTVYLEDGQGRRMEPVGLYIYELWLNWTLNVWWTHDRWVNGKHVLHEAGDWTEKGKSKAGGGTLPVYRKGNEKSASVWNRLGFSHAAEGAKGIGAEFPVDLAKTGPVSIVVHTTLPDKDPVMTDPFIYTLSDDGKGGVRVEAAAATIACAGAAGGPAVVAQEPPALPELTPAKTGGAAKKPRKVIKRRGAIND